MNLTSKLLRGSAFVILAGTSLAFFGAGALTITAAARPFAHSGGGQNIPAPTPPGVYPPAVAGTVKNYSLNWSGFAQTGPQNSFKAVEDTWTVPTVNTTATGNQYSADWVGIGGFSDSSLVQDGTEADNVNGTARYDAWTEILPANEVVLKGLAISPGDMIKATVVETSTNRWSMTVDDLTTGQSGNRTVSYDSSGASAEAVHERPEVGQGLSTLAQTNNITFTPGESSIAPVGTPAYEPVLKAIAGGKLYQMFMENRADKIIASPSVATPNRDGFAVADGSTSPPAP